MKWNRQSGVTLIELMIVVTIIAIIMGIAYPAYTDQTRKARRTEAISKLQEYQLLQERYRANNPSFGSLADLGVSPTSDDHYDYSVTNNTASTYTMTATAKTTSDQYADTQCRVITINQSNDKSPAVCF